MGEVAEGSPRWRGVEARRGKWLKEIPGGMIGGLEYFRVSIGNGLDVGPRYISCNEGMADGKKGSTYNLVIIKQF